MENINNQNNNTPNKKNTKLWFFIIGILIVVIIGFIIYSLLIKQGIPMPVENATLIIEPITLPEITEKASITKHYSLEPLSINLNAPSYDFPLKNSDISNFNDFSSQINLGSDANNLLQQNGFVVIENPFNQNEEFITSPYETLKGREIPIFITSDSLLHLYHIQFDETLRQIEEKEFYDTIWTIDKKLLEESIRDYNSASGELKESAKNNVAYFSVALSLLQPTSDQIMEECANNDWECQAQDKTAFFTKEELNKYTFEVPSFVQDVVDEELEFIDVHSGFEESPIFKYNEDYSQYIPRGHYTRSEKLKNYFKAFMWHGRISMLLKGDLINLPEDEQIREARIQTMSAGLIASKLGSDNETMDKWDRIYGVTAFYVGLSDDLGPYEYLESMNSVFGNEFDANDMNEDTIGQLKAKLAEYQPPAIYGGTGFAVDGGCSVAPPFTPEQADKCLENTKGFRFMGQRFIPDSYMFQNLVFGYVTQHFTLTPSNWNELPFTSGLVDTPSGPIVARVFPRGLDVMALLGSERAKELIIKLGEDQYDKYDEKFVELEKEFNEFSVEEWNKNLYWAWLYSLKPLLKDFGDGYPTFMQTEAWQDKELTTALASWAELRHDTILYAKQSYTMAGTTGFPPPEPEVVGYVEPVPEFYNRLLALTRMTNNGLDEMAVLDDTSKRRLQSLESILERLVQISKDELENKELTQEDYDFIKNFGGQLKGVIADVDDKARKTTIIADVHTDGNSKQVLEEGVGYVDLIVVAYKVPDGRVLIGAGPVMTYYEFKHPMADRLTDEKWRDDVLKNNPPEKTEWNSNFAVN